MKKIYLVLILLLFPIFSLNAVDTSDVNYEVESIHMYANIEVSGSVNFQEIIKITGTYNGYIRDILYKNSSLKKFTGVKDDFYGSDIYNGYKININKVGTLNVDDFITEDFSEEFLNKNLKVYEKEGKGNYELSDLDGGKSIKMYNETKNGSTYFYINYTVLDLIVEHNDCAEFYYNIIGENFDDNIDEVTAIVYLPARDKENIKVWAHGPLTGSAYILDDGYGAALKINNLYSNTPIDLRMTYSKNLLMINLNENKKSGIDALPYILDVEEERANDANEQRERAKGILNIIYYIGGFYFVGLITLFIFTYIKFDKEYASTFFNKYNREFIEDYDVEVIEYLMNKNITTKAFSASILNLIYKKKIKVEEIKGKKKDYEFTLENEKKLSENETIIIDLLFKTIGSDKKVKMSEIKSESKKVDVNNKNRIYSSYQDWERNVKITAKSQNFFINNTKAKVLLCFYGTVGFAVGYLMMFTGVAEIYFIGIIISSIVFILYVLVFSKKSIKGNEHYNKWKAFKRFLNDFGRFKEKELPEIVLWERYLVYATVFGIADKVNKAMAIKFENMNDTNINRNLFNNYYLFNIGNDISREVSHAVTRSISTYNAANSNTSSGSGLGGGFSSGGGFGGGGGGGRGF